MTDGTAVRRAAGMIAAARVPSAARAVTTAEPVVPVTAGVVVVVTAGARIIAGATAAGTIEAETTVVAAAPGVAGMMTGVRAVVAGVSGMLRMGVVAGTIAAALWAAGTMTGVRAVPAVVAPVGAGARTLAGTLVGGTTRATGAAEPAAMRAASSPTGRADVTGEPGADTALGLVMMGAVMMLVRAAPGASSGMAGAPTGTGAMTMTAHAGTTEYRTRAQDVPRTNRR
ncbi:hypothetical protein [Propionibacterium australiense]|nr:hypothetical protein [Propionibacterium australiense]